jgi:uncharacterized membrane protein
VTVLRTRTTAWAVPTAYAVAAIVLGVTLTRVERHLWPSLAASISVDSAIALFSAIASGTMTLSAIVFSLTFVMLQFSSTAYSPRLVLWLLRDRLISHALGVFTGTFIYALVALAWVDRSHSGRVPLLSAVVVVTWLLASIAMFIALIQRVALLQVGRMLAFTGDQGRRVIAALYTGARPRPQDVVDEIDTVAPTHTVVHHGRPLTVQAIDVHALVRLAQAADARIDVAVAVGDRVMEATTLARVRARDAVSEAAIRRGIALGHDRTFEQDPQYAVRLLVDIAIRALSPAVNDPTTAVQALDEIGDLLLRLGRSALATAPFRDDRGIIRVVVPLPTWDDLLLLAFDEICFYGATSLQVMRRMNALVSELLAGLPAERHAAIEYWQDRLDNSIETHFPDLDQRRDASARDRQGFGVSRRPAA